MKIVSKTEAGVQPVYDIGVPELHNFELANGLVASNCFNKSHSISYSVITYACAWLKANHPLEFFCALMSLRSQSLQPKDWAAKAPQYLNEARQLGVTVEAPRINESVLGFSIVDGKIYFGFNAIRDVGKTAGRSITRARGKRGFKDVLDFLARVDKTKVTRRVFQALVKAGAFDRMGYIREELLEKTDELYDYWANKQLYAEKLVKLAAYEIEKREVEDLIKTRDELRKIKRASERKRNPGPPLDIMEEESLEKLEAMKLRRKARPKDMPNPDEAPPELTRTNRVPITVDQLIEQAEYIGCFVDRHPAHIVFPNTQRLRSCDLGDYVLTAGMVNSFKKIITRKGQPMAFMEIGDETGSAEIIVFPNVYAKLEREEALPEVGNIVRLKGKCESTDPMIKVIANKIGIYRGNNEL